MNLPAQPRPCVVRVTGTALAALALAVGMSVTASGARAAVQGPPVATANPYSPAYHHSYRGGVIPTIGQQAMMRRWSGAHPAQAALSASNLNYGGAIDGIGVTTGQEKVYLVFFGSQWGSQGTDASGNVTLSGDPSGEAPYLQRLMKGLGTNGDLWSGVMTQYCDGVAAGSQSCPASNTEHVAYPVSPPFAGVWVDESTASPQQASGHQLGVEAVAAAAHFGNTTAAANRDAQYVILSPTRTTPDGFNAGGGFCAWHDYNGDSGLSGGPVSSSFGDIAFTNMPYVTDAGASCGQNFLSSNLDGVSIVEGHEYAETITDQNPPGGYTDSRGEENGDKCAWITPGTSGGVFDLSLASGTFAMQTTWGNDGSGGNGACEASHPVVTNGGGGGTGNTVMVSNPGSQAGTVGTAASLQVSATDSAAGQTLTYSATGLPAGLSISSSTGLISGTPTTAGTFSAAVKATDTTGASGSAAFTWTIATPGGGGGGPLVNGGFETGGMSPWTCQPGGAVVTSPVHSGGFALQVAATTTQTGECDQSVTLSPNTSYTLTGWVQGNFAFVGVSGGASASTFTSSSTFAKLSVTFTTGSTGAVTVFVHGWYGQGTVFADDFSVG